MAKTKKQEADERRQRYINDLLTFNERTAAAAKQKAEDAANRRAARRAAEERANHNDRMDSHSQDAQSAARNAENRSRQLEEQRRRDPVSQSQQNKKVNEQVRQNERRQARTDTAFKRAENRDAAEAEQRVVNQAIDRNNGAAAADALLRGEEPGENFVSRSRPRVVEPRRQREKTSFESDIAKLKQERYDRQIADREEEQYWENFNAQEDARSVDQMLERLDTENNAEWKEQMASFSRRQKPAIEPKRAKNLQKLAKQHQQELANRQAAEQRAQETVKAEKRANAVNNLNKNVKNLTPAELIKRREKRALQTRQKKFDRAEELRRRAENLAKWRAKKKAAAEKKAARRFGTNPVAKLGSQNKPKGFSSGNQKPFGGDPANGMIADPSDVLANQKMQYIEVYSLVSGYTTAFKAYITNYQDNFKSDWSRTQVYGRMDPIVNFKNTTRQIVCEFDIPAVSPEEAKQNMERISTLVQMLYPSYEEEGAFGSQQQGARTFPGSTIKGAPMVKISFMNWIQHAGKMHAEASTSGLMGYLDGFSFNPEMKDTGFFQGKWPTGRHSAYLYPKSIQASFTLNVIHEHELGWVQVDNKMIPRQGNFPYGLESGDKTSFRKPTTFEQENSGKNDNINEAKALRINGSDDEGG